MFIHGYLLMEGHKMSKSLGNVLDPDEVIDKFGADALRFYCFREVSFGQDGSDLARRVRGALRDRARRPVRQPRQPGALDDRPLPRRGGSRRRGGGRRSPANSRARPTASGGCSTTRELTQALEEIWKLVRRLNQYVEETKPWELAKDDSAAERAGLGPLRPGRGAAGDDPLLHAYMPETTARLLEALGESGRELAEFGSRGGGQSLGELAPLFPKLELA